MEKEQRKRVFKAELWKQAINLRKIDEDLAIMNENLQWVEKMIKVSKKLYSNAKLAQQGVLEIQIRKNNIETKIIEIEFKKKEVESLLGYLAGLEESKSLDLKTIPWSKLDNGKNKLSDYQEKKIEKELRACEYQLKSIQLNIVPDLTFGISYTTRSNIDNRGDFVGASVSFPLPLSGKKYAYHSNSVRQKTTKEREFRNYKLKKRSKLKEIAFKKERYLKELDILKNKTLNFAKSARDVTSRSYRLGNSGYVELLNAEINLQNYLLKKTELESTLDNLKIEEVLLSGGKI
jgi:outer membrane protein TolC